MKQLSILYVQAIIIFIGVHITPAALASIITLDLSLYMSWVTSPLYHTIMFFVSLATTCGALDYLKNQSYDTDKY
jgi:hypothetical protein